MRVGVFVCGLQPAKITLWAFIQLTILSGQSHISEIIVICHVSKGRLQEVG